ncbi:Golgin subfamily A member 7/ERF4 family-domain-containing protein [Annulohypoxylon maeteangense]|uniref:Golgin subfamily A member 7/ERF4 family-domain-containing protein n=1 Tax=Annulohypoxylon maeteangense TaxID=1927788 RepID=UPI0020086DDB|nr:Golgin subfamily A member 7/ERF4 family-domain-containing protein [Annulohypoxylon maeteangense]KAI0887136.1 Golgin subfamily A member 7/ERF4 family-domain-containing protein [Annulohypoxylon maeteangense]
MSNGILPGAVEIEHYALDMFPLFSEARAMTITSTQHNRCNDSAAIPTRPTNLSPAALDAPQANDSVNSPSQQPEYPTVLVPRPVAATGVTGHQRQKSGNRRNLVPPGPYDYIPQSPFRNRAAATNTNTNNNLNSLYRINRRFGPGRLWNPTNSTPRILTSRPQRTSRQFQPSRKRRPSTPPPPSVPVNNPTIQVSSDANETIGFGAGDYPLLSLPEQSKRASLSIEGRTSGDKRISLPASVRHSYDGKRISNPLFLQETEAGPSEPKAEKSITTGLRKRGQSVTKRARAISFGLVRAETSETSPKKIDKGKGKAVMPQVENDDPARSFSKDLERGPSVLSRRHNGSNLSLPGGIGSATTSSNSSIMGDPDQPDLGEEWGPQHPCYPHLNPHVPINSPEYANTRIIRIRRDWLLEGDLAPAFSNLYPEILDPAGVSELEFRRIIEKFNRELIPIYNPYNWRNILDGILGLLTGWIWDDLGFTYAKTRLRHLDAWVDKWNIEMEKSVGSDENTIPPRIISLRRTGYMNLDFQISDPEIAPASTEPSGSRSGPNMADFKPAMLPDSPIEA